MITSQIKAYATAALAVVVGIFAAMFKYRGHKIDQQQKEIDQAKVDKVVLESAINVQKETTKKVQDANEILTEPDDVDAAADRLRSRSKNRNSGEGEL